MTELLQSLYVTRWVRRLFSKEEDSNNVGKRDVAAKLVRLFEIMPTKTHSNHHLARQLGVRSIQEQRMLDDALMLLLKRKTIEEPFPGRYCFAENNRVKGVVDLSAPERPVLITGRFKKDIPVALKDLNGAQHGDNVSAIVFMNEKGRQSAEVLRVMHYAQQRLVGTIEVMKQKAFFIADNYGAFRDIMIPLENVQKAQSGDRVVVDLEPWTQERRYMRGKVVEVIGHANEEHTDFAAFVTRNGFKYKFTPEEETAAENMVTPFTATENAKRRDMRDITTFTIDPEGCVDIDDAISFRKLENGNYEIGIHIADVTHYIKEGTMVDRAAYSRATSVYIGDQVLHMLPQALLDICSLVPNEDRYAMSVIVEITKEAKVIKSDITRSVIHSKRKFSYTEATDAILNKRGEYQKEINYLYDLSQILRKQRTDNGSLSFEGRAELNIKFDKSMKPTDITPKIRTEAMYLIEEFMILANVEIATKISKMTQKRGSSPFIYRVHGLPDAKRFAEFRRVAARLGYPLAANTDREISIQLGKLLEKIRGKREENLLITLALQSMAKAYYSTVNRGHYGLAERFYTHFTSPMRRYSDVVVHRLIDHYLFANGGNLNYEDYEEKCRHITRMQERADLFEKRYDAMKVAEFFEHRVGEEFEGIITNISNSEINIEIFDMGVVGAVPIFSLMDDVYVFNSKNYVLEGEATQKRYAAGDRVRIRVHSADRMRGSLRFKMLAKLTD